MSLYIKLQTEILTDPKVLMAGPEGFTLWAKGLCWSLQHLTNGFIPTEILEILCAGMKKPEQIARKLCAVGLWKKVEGGYTVGEEKWAKHQRTSQEVELKKEQNRERQQRYRDKTKSSDRRVSNDERNALLTQPDNRSQITDNSNTPLAPQGDVWEILPPEYHEPAKRFAEYRKKNKWKPLQQMTWARQPEIFRNDPDRFARAVDYTIGKGWQGLQEPHDKPRAGIDWNRIESDVDSELSAAGVIQ